MDDEAADAADDRADENAALLPVEEARYAKHAERQQIVQQHRRRPPGIRAVEQQLQKAIGKRREERRADAPARTVEEDGQHADADASALRQLEQLQIAQRRCQRNHDGALAERTQLFVFHKIFLLSL